VQVPVDATGGVLDGGGGVARLLTEITKDGNVVYDNRLGSTDDVSGAQILTGGCIQARVGLRLKWERGRGSGS
jgi:hypothetical protein